MMAVAPAGLATAWVVLIASLGWRYRPASLRPRSRFDLNVPPAVITPAMRGQAGPADAGSRRRLMVLGCGVLVASVISPKLLIVVALVSVAERRSRRVRQKRQQARAVMVELPEIVDFYVVGLTAGLTVAQTTRAVAEQLEGAVSSALREAVVRAEHGARLSDELAALPMVAGDGVRPLSRILVDAERHGVAIGDALGRLSHDVRIQRRRWAEIRARRVPVKLLFPLVICTLPAFVLLSIVPVLVSALQGI